MFLYLNEICVMYLPNYCIFYSRLLNYNLIKVVNYFIYFERQISTGLNIGNI